MRHAVTGEEIDRAKIEREGRDIELVVLPPQGEKCVVDWDIGLRSEYLYCAESDAIEAEPALLVECDTDLALDFEREDCTTICHLVDAEAQDNAAYERHEERCSGQG